MPGPQDATTSATTSAPPGGTGSSGPASGEARAPGGDAFAPGAVPLSITDFLTDGALAGACTELSRLTGVRIELRDAAGRVIVQRPHETLAGQTTWAIAGQAEPPGPNDTVIPLQLSGTSIGAMVLAAGEPSLAPDARDRLTGVLRLLAQTSTELCQDDLELRYRIKQVTALSRISSMLVGAAEPQRVLEVALESALEVLGLDAGSIVLLKDESSGFVREDEEDLELRVSRNLSDDWLRCPQPLSKGRLFDRMALGGQIVVSEDLWSDDRVLIMDRVRREGLRSTIQAGLVFKNRPLGIIRLYSRGPGAFDEADLRLLGSMAQQAAAAIEQARLLQFEREEQRVQRQLQLARDVQRRMLPKSVPNARGLDVAARYIPSFELGGDFYDFVDLSGHMGVFVGDVVGKGIAAALLMSAVRASLLAHVQGVYNIDDVIVKVNQALCRDTLDNEFASLWYGVIDIDHMRMTYCSAGHEPTLVIRVPRHRKPTTADVDELGVGGMVVGIDPSQRYQRAVYDLHPNDCVVAYTDGVPDTLNFEGERFGKKRLRDALLRFLGEEPDATAAQVVERILWELRQFAGLSTRPDDTTIVAIRIAGRS